MTWRKKIAKKQYQTQTEEEIIKTKREKSQNVDNNDRHETATEARTCRVWAASRSDAADAGACLCEAKSQVRTSEISNQKLKHKIQISKLCKEKQKSKHTHTHTQRERERERPARHSPHCFVAEVVQVLCEMLGDVHLRAGVDGTQRHARDTQKRYEPTHHIQKKKKTKTNRNAHIDIDTHGTHMQSAGVVATVTDLMVEELRSGVQLLSAEHLKRHELTRLIQFLRAPMTCTNVGRRNKGVGSIARGAQSTGAQCTRSPYPGCGELTMSQRAALDTSCLALFL